MTRGKFLLRCSLLSTLIIFLLNIPVGFSEKAKKNTGRLPRGESKANTTLHQKKSKELVDKKDSALDKENERKKSKRIETCHDYHLFPYGGLIFFSSLAQEFFYLARNSINESNLSSKKYRYNLYRITLGSIPIKVKKIVSTISLPSVSLVPHGKRTIGVSIFSFKSLPDGCHEGIGSAFSIPLDTGMKLQKKVIDLKPTKTVKSGRYKIVEGRDGRYFADLDRRFIREIDITSFQQRSAFRFAEGEIPLYWDSDYKLLYVWRGKPLRTLKRYQTVASNLTKELMLKDNEKLLQAKGAFGVARINSDSNSIVIKPYNMWSKSPGTPKTYRISLPAGYPVTDVSVSVHFNKKLAIISGGSIEARKNWERVFVFNYEDGQRISDLKLKRANYCSFAGLEPKGDYAVVVLQEKVTDAHASLNLFSLKDKKWYSITLD